MGKDSSEPDTSSSPSQSFTLMGAPDLKFTSPETNNSWNKQMHRLCKDSKTQMCRLQLNTRTAHFQAKRMPVYTFSVLLSIVALIWASSVKFRISFLLLPVLKPVSFPNISFCSLKHHCKIISYSAASLHEKDPNNSWNPPQFVCCLVSSPQKLWVEKLVCPGQ